MLSKYLGCKPVFNPCQQVKLVLFFPIPTRNPVVPMNLNLLFVCKSS